MIATNWKSKLSEKLAAAQTRDNAEVAEAFAQQAYTAVGNRDKEIMRDPFLLGFEVIEQNEDNSKLLGSFAFRVNQEILLVPVFFLNGQIKGHQLLYRKGVKRFCPNTEKWVAYLLSQGEDNEGRPIPRDGRQSRIHLPLDRLLGKRASELTALDVMDQPTLDRWDAEALEFDSEVNWWKEASWLRALGWGAGIGGSAGVLGFGGNKLRERGITAEQARAAAAEKDYAHMERIRAELAAYAKGQKPQNPVDLPKADTKSLWANPLVLGGLALGIPVTVLAAQEYQRRKQEREKDASWGRILGGVGAGVAAGGLGYWAPGRAEKAWDNYQTENAERVSQDKMRAAMLAKYENALEQARQKANSPVAKTTEAVKSWSEKGKSLGTNPFVLASLALGIPAAVIAANEYRARQEKEKEKGKQASWGERFKDIGNRINQMLIQPAGKSFDLVTPAPGATPAQALGTPFKRYEEAVKPPKSAPPAPPAKDKKSGWIRQLWKEAMAEWEVTAPEHLFADLLLEHDLRKEATMLVSRLPEFGDWIAGGKLLEKAAKQRPAPEPTLQLWTEPPGHLGDAMVEEFYKRGYAIDDKRSDKEVSKRIRFRRSEVAVNSLRCPGVRKACTKDGTVKVLWGEAGEDCCRPASPLEDRGRHLDKDHLLVVLEGPEKGARRLFDSYDAVSSLPVFEQEEMEKEEPPGTDKPVKGKAYYLWTGTSFLSGYPLKVHSVEKQGDVIRINTDVPKDEYAATAYYNPKLDKSERRNGDWMLGADVRFVEAKTVGQGSQPQSACCEWLTCNDIQNVVMEKSAKVGIRFGPHLHDLTLDGRRIGEKLTERQLVTKLATVARMSVAEALEVVDDRVTDFRIHLPKEASSIYFDRDIDFDREFSQEDYDPDLLLRELPAEQQSNVMAIRQQRPAPARHFLDAKGYGGPRNLDHIPDEVILGMTDPARQMAEMGQQLGLDTLMDHGAVGALTKVFNAGPYIKEYVNKLEVSLDYMARLLFMLFWKPRDFSKTFGDDDLVSLEQKLIGTFESSGDLILNLLQSTGDKGEI